jgi:hypothetical protein
MAASSALLVLLLPDLARQRWLAYSRQYTAVPAAKRAVETLTCMLTVSQETRRSEVRLYAARRTVT